ncbi:winged helix-turn-helix domain-containing protein [Ruegeria sp. WL0004]|uniref:Winged helix-turn-helix domain-containing protein n=1 Tax=Ruegeria marisflavi TaxID=2984152 RepID=A0ABT2WWX2_9RHOB|nr:winged helix-turn-helix domain-containing protein [Ruegeria sp. WL0004]MCU9840389.1 winged helix-turn-helix domain-containing protein [Ruegeria sp. WL0004]
MIDQEGRPVAVREKSLRLLCKLAERNGEIVNRDDLISAVWSGRSVSDDNLVQCIKDIRAVLGDRDRQLLRTAVGRGYSLHGVREKSIGPGAHPKLLISPLRIMGDAPELIELAEIVTEELIIALSPRAGLKVTTDETQRETALYAIDGRASLSGEEVRVFVQLVSGRSGDVAFAETWSIPITEAEFLPRQITDKITNVLRVKMFNYAGEDYIGRSNDELDTQELLAKAAYHMSRIQMQNRDVARNALSLAIEREPTNAMALAMRASAAVLSILQESRSKLPDAPEYCLELADRAVGIAPHIDFVMRTRGSLRLWLKGDHEGARADCERALEISSVFHLAHQTIALSEILSGEHAAGIHRVQKIMELGTPTNPRYPHYLALLALGQILAGENDAAIKIAQEGHERAPGDPWCNYVFAAAVADRKEIANTERFRHMIARNDLPLTHFRDQAFTDLRDVDMLEERLALAGYPRTA